MSSTALSLPNCTWISCAQPLYVMTLMNPLPIYFALEHLLINILALSTMTQQETFRLCHTMAVCATLLSTITSQTPSLLFPYPVSMIRLFYTYKIVFDELAAKGFKPKLYIMDNQATKYIKKFSHQSASSSLWSPTTTG
jgi:hypothetical protein